MGGCLSTTTNRAVQQLPPAPQPAHPTANSRLVAHTTPIDLGRHLRAHHGTHPLPRSELLRIRSEFWDTAPTYGGHAEIWQALRLACESDDESLARAIIESVGVAVPSGSLVDGCFDERGECYEIPAYCLSMPINVVDGYVGSMDSGRSLGLQTAVMGTKSPKPTMGEELEDNESLASTSYPTNQMDNTNKQIVDSAEWQRIARIRLCVGRDAEVRLGQTTTTQEIEEQLRENKMIPASTPRVQFFYLGRRLDSSVAPIRDLHIPSNAVIQAMYAT